MYILLKYDNMLTNNITYIYFGRIWNIYMIKNVFLMYCLVAYAIHNFISLTLNAFSSFM